MTYNVKVEINIPEMQEKGNSPLGKRIFAPALIVLVGALAYGAIKLGNIEANRQPVTISYESSIISTTSKTMITPRESPSIDSPVPVGAYVAARGGTAYYLPSCAASKRIAEKNKIWFQTRQEAEKMGYKPAQNCPGLK